MEFADPDQLIDVIISTAIEAGQMIRDAQVSSATLKTKKNCM
jgi:hypothetical protein